MDYQKMFNNLADKLGISSQKARRLSRTNKIPMDLALQAELVTDGKLPAHALNDMFHLERPALKQYAKACVVYFQTANKSDPGMLFLIRTLDFLETAHPKTYERVAFEIETLEGGDVFIANRKHGHA
jgi:hypothetical protein